MQITYMITNSGATVTIDGKPHTVKKDHVNFPDLCQALMAGQEDQVIQFLTVQGVLRKWYETCEGFMEADGQVLFHGKPVVDSLRDKILQLVAAGHDPRELTEFWRRLSRNPSWRSVQQLFPFLLHRGISITPRGTILAYKAVRPDWTDFHSGTVLNTVGSRPEMPRNEISDDPNEACHVGFHAGALAYAQSFGDSTRRILVVEIDPEDVVCIPYDCDCQKMRVCRYFVAGIHGGPLSSSVEIEDLPVTPEPEAPVPEAPVAPTSQDPELDSMNLSQLRSYASQVLKIVGASKIPGGRTALLDRIRRG